MESGSVCDPLKKSQSKDQSESAKLQSLIDQLKGHGHLLSLQINSLQKTLMENNVEIQMMNDSISRLDASVDLAAFHTQHFRRKLTDSELESRIASDLVSNYREELAFFAKHVRQLKSGVELYKDATIRQASTLNAQRETIARIQHQHESILDDIQIQLPDNQIVGERSDKMLDVNKRIIILEDIQIRPPDKGCSADPVMFDGTAEPDTA